MLEGRTALITGGGRGIGAATARLFAKHGAMVAVNYHQNTKAAIALVKSIDDEGGTAASFQADVRDPNSVAAMIKAVESQLGPIDTLVSNASISFPTAPFIEYPWEAFEAKLVGELKSAFNCCRAVVPGMIARKKGCIIAVSSGLSRRPGPGFCAHTTAKSGLDGLMKSLALELGPMGIRVNVVAPGLTLTDAVAHMPEQMRQLSAKSTPLQRNAEAADIAGAILLLASEEARFLTGTYLPVSGGSLML
jgi:3-oxoacyl-[acyl-carrier protein] reductase